MPDNQDEPLPLRQLAGEEIDRCEVQTLTIGALFGRVVQGHSRNCFALGMDLLSDQSSPKDWVQHGVASWIRCYERQVALYKGICSVACPSPQSKDKTYAGKVGANVLFVVDRFAESTEPVATSIPAGEIDNVTVALGSSIDRHIRLSLLDDGDGGQIVGVGLVGLRPDQGAPDPLPPGARRRTTLQWNVLGGGGTLQMRVTAKRLRANVSNA